MMNRLFFGLGLLFGWVKSNVLYFFASIPDFLHGREETQSVSLPIAVVENTAYWVFDNKWYTAPMYHGPDLKQVTEIDINTAPIEQVDLLMQILGRFDEVSSAGE